MGAECFITYQITTALHNFTLPKRVGSVQRVLLRRPHECTRNSACIIAAAAAAPLLFLVCTYCAAIISQGKEGSPHRGRGEGKRGLLDLEIGHAACFVTCAEIITWFGDTRKKYFLQAKSSFTFYLRRGTSTQVYKSILFPPPPPPPFSWEQKAFEGQ